MEKVKNIIIRVTDKLEESCVLGAIRQAMIMMIPLLVVGYMSAMFLDLPIPAYQMFITTLFEDMLLKCCSVSIRQLMIFLCILVVATSVSYSIIKRKSREYMKVPGILLFLSLFLWQHLPGIPEYSMMIFLLRSLVICTRLVHCWFPWFRVRCIMC